MKIKHGIIGLLTLATLAMPVATTEASTLDSIEAEEEAKQDELQTLESEISQALDEINAIHVNLENLEAEIEETEESIKETQEDIVVKEEEVEKRNEVMKENLRNIQTSEMNHSMIISILDSESLSEMFNRLQALATLQSASSDSFENAQNEHNELLALKEKNEAEKEKLVNDKATVEAQESEMSKKVAELNTKLENNKEELKVLASRKQNEETRLREEAEKIQAAKAAKEAAEEEAKVVQLAEAQEAEESKNNVIETIIDTTSKETPKPAKMDNPAPEPVVKNDEKVSQPKPESKPEPKPEPKPESNGRTMTVVATAYSTNQPSLSTHTATGIDLRSNPSVIAVDPNVIPLGSTVEIPGYGVFTAGDTGGAINGNRIDIHMTNLGTARGFGYQTMEIKILN